MSRTQAPDQIWLLVDSRHGGGIETHIVILARALIRAGRPVIITRVRNYGEHPVFDKKGAPPNRVFRGARDAIGAMRRERPWVVHTHGYKAGVIGRLAGTVSRTPIVSTYHSGDLGSGAVRAYTFLDDATAPLAVSLAVSPAIATRIKSATLIDNFVEPPSSLHAFVDHRPLTFGFVGRLSHEKGIDRFCRLARRLPDCRFVAFGDGPMAGDARTIAAGRVDFRGFESDPRVIWGAVDVLCMPSRAEGLPMAALEALARGVPAIAAPVGALPELLAEGGGLIVRRDTDDAWETAVRRYATFRPPQLARIGALGRARILQRYTPDAVLPRILAAYSEARRRVGLQSEPNDDANRDAA